MITEFSRKSWLNYSILLIGGYRTLPLAEVKAVLESEDISFKILELDNSLLRISIESPPYPLKTRSSMTRLCCIELGCGRASYEEIIETTKNIDWSIIDGKSFSVRVYKYGNVTLTEKSYLIERKVGGIILRSTVGSRVDIERPDIKVIVLISSKSFSMGLLLFEREKGISTRRPKLRPFFHPSSLDSMLARALVNLSRCKSGDVLLDPFVGTGSIIVEAALIGCEAIGIDINASTVKGCLKNCVFYEVYKVTNALNADATVWPLREHSINRIVTDPPYGRISSTRGKRAHELIRGLLDMTQRVLCDHGMLVFMHPRDSKLEKAINEYSFKLIEEHEIRVHKGLTRVVKVVKFD